MLLDRQQRSGSTCKRLLAEAGIELSDIGSISEDERRWLDTWFMERVFPVLTPLAIDPAHPFPFIPNMGLVMALQLHREEDSANPSPHGGHYMRGLIPLPGQVDRFIRLPSAPVRGAGAPPRLSAS